MKFAIAVFSQPHSAASRRALRFAQAVIESGHSIELLFFAQEGVHNANLNWLPPQDEININQQWHNFITQHQLQAVLCISAALRRGLLDSQEAGRYQKKTAITVNAPWQMGSLAQWHIAMQQSDRSLCFKED